MERNKAREKQGLRETSVETINVGEKQGLREKRQERKKAEEKQD